MYAVHDVSFQIRRGETMALVGESGSGKSITSLALMRLAPRACVLEGDVRLHSRTGKSYELLKLREAEMRGVRGPVVSMVFQEPMTAFNPVLTIGQQIVEMLMFHTSLSKRQRAERAADLLNSVGIADAHKRLSSYPHQLSGGMRQRAMIAMALACEPDLMIADEPTTALDVTVQAQITELLYNIQQSSGMALLFVTHNLGLVAEIADRVMVMYLGRIVEQGDVVTLFKRPAMPYTKGLLESMPRIDLAGRRSGPLHAIPGQVPGISDQPKGCGFAPRCPHFIPDLCDREVPALYEIEPNHCVRCVNVGAPPARNVQLLRARSDE
ncbi:ABC transporter ATP-binding protein [Bradyrhizobium sp. BWA-3-5]|uniref:ABC transporter ATP-binding protein n=1 Tax=Bradyrhizobium sp. BWA-3-5 TaxID=3080013 RepID=UPI00397A7B75